jgi:predicted Zn-dependent protease with MMP-like domain
MDSVSDEQFDKLISQAIDELPQEYITNLNNVVITYADEPTPEQSKKQGIRRGQLLLGLYEGIPLTRRGAGYNLVIPDKITLFKKSILQMSHDESSFYKQIKHTLWHEIAHFYGLNHVRIKQLEERAKG